MSPTLQNLKDAAATFTAAERTELAQYLLHSIDEPDVSGERAEWLAPAERRTAEVRTGIVVGIPAEEVVRNLLGPVAIHSR